MYKNSTLSFLSRHSVQLSRPNEGIGFGPFLQGSLATIGSIELVLTPLFPFENNSLTKCNKRMEKPILGISSVNVCR